jgi:hypothetical protein
MSETTVCIRCGKARIFSKSWDEQVGSSKIVYTITVCPDPVCQKKVEELLKDKHDLNETRKRESLERREANRIKGVEARKSRVQLVLGKKSSRPKL